MNWQSSFRWVELLFIYWTIFNHFPNSYLFNILSCRISTPKKTYPPLKLNGCFLLNGIYLKYTYNVFLDIVLIVYTTDCIYLPILIIHNFLISYIKVILIQFKIIHWQVNYTYNLIIDNDLHFKYYPWIKWVPVKCETE